jgi:hypothetical protein
MQGARKAHIHWPIFNRRAAPQDGMDRFPDADVFLGQDTSGAPVWSRATSPAVRNPALPDSYFTVASGGRRACAEMALSSHSATTAFASLSIAR